MRHSSVLTAVAMLVLFSACLVTTRTGSAPPPPPPRGEPPPRHRPPPPPQERFLEGTVSDAVTGRGLPRASVDIVDPQSRTQTVTTDANGHYRTAPLPPGRFAIRCRLDGYEAFEQGYSVTDGPARLDCPLKPRRR